MSIINRRNAVLGWGIWQLVKRIRPALGWGTWQVAKRAGKRKARAAVPGPGDHAGLNKSAIASIAAVTGGAVWFWRKKSSDEGADTSE
jgi:hypothetical protein